MSTLRIILGDQLNLGMSSLRDANFEKDTFFLHEGMDEFIHVKHHKKKLAFFMASRRKFAQMLERKSSKVFFQTLDDPQNPQDLVESLKLAVNKANPNFKQLIVTKPTDYHVLTKVNNLSNIFPDVQVEIREADHFLCSLEEFRKWEASRKKVTMEFFYRMMRKKYNILMKEGRPIGGKWNYDSQNRETLDGKTEVPKHPVFKTDETTEKVMNIVEEMFSAHFGDVHPFELATSRDDALKALDSFVSERLPLFGRYQDAMVQNKPFLFHSCLSLYLNIGLLHPMECIQRAVRAYEVGSVPLNAVEGFVRQIIGWREFVRGIYLLKMPAYRSQNFLNAQRSLPNFFWTGETKLNCLKVSIHDTKRNAYAHHIQRLMVIGNFCLLTGIDPKEVNEWYWVVYADAFEWVELPNVSGMTLYADGGCLATKPYASSGSYINKMSNYCKFCVYSPTKKSGKQACPFNYLYWDFLSRNKTLLEANYRLRLPYSTLARFSKEKIRKIQDDSTAFFEEIF